MDALIAGFLRRCEKLGLSRETIATCNEILSLDPRIDPLDAVHIATAISEDCTHFVFIDYALGENTTIRTFAKQRGLNLLNFAIAANVDDQRKGRGFSWLE